MKELMKSLVPGITDGQSDKFARYYELLVDWNSRVNLTAITDEREVAEKHFADSLLPSALIPEGARVIDVGTGAGFPGVPLMIMRDDISVVLPDSLQKRLVFLEALLAELGLSARLVHMRAEDAGRDAGLRESFDATLTRAVAPASVALELTVPLLKVGGASLLYKGQKAAEELKAAERATGLL